MRTHNAENERIKRQYFHYLKEAKRYSEASLNGVAKALSRFETYTKFRDFRSFHIQQAMGFKRHLAEQTSVRHGTPLSKATLHSTLAALRNFFHWLAGRPGFRSRVTYADAEYFNLSEKEIRIAKAHREQRVPTIDQILHVLRMMPAATELELRNRALIALTLLTAARDSAIASLKLKHVDLVESKVVQDAREVNTKFSKSFTTHFFPVGTEVSRIVEDWVKYLLKTKLWGPDDPLFPATLVKVGANQHFEVSGLDRKHWSNATPIRKIFREAFANAGLPYFNPHSFRKTLAQLGERVCQTPEQFKAWSQNLGHDNVLTTLSSYGEVSARRQAELIRALAASPSDGTALTDMASRLLAEIQRRETPALSPSAGRSDAKSVPNVGRNVG